MPDGRMLRKKISFDERLGQVSLESLLVFTWMIPHLDVKGRILGDIFHIKATVFPLIDQLSTKKIKKALTELEKLNLILIYGGKIKYIQFNGFLKNQKICENREAKSTIPDPDLLTSNSRVTQDVSLKLSSSLNSSLKLRAEAEVQNEVEDEIPTDNANLSNDDLPLPSLTKSPERITSTEPEDYENIFQVTDSIKNLLSIHCKIYEPDKSTLSALVNLVMKTEQVRNSTAFKNLRDTFIEFKNFPDEKQNLKYLYSRAKGRMNDMLIKRREELAKREKDQLNNNIDTISKTADVNIGQIANKFQMG